MTSSATERVEQKTEGIELSGEKRICARRRFVAGACLFVAILAALVAGGWGLLVSLNVQGPPARVGETVEVSGGLLRVDDVTAEQMAPMQTKKYQRSGMSMSANVPDMTPEGYRRFNVDVTLAAENSDINYLAKDFKLTGEGIDEAAPLRHRLDTDTLVQGSTIAGVLIFQVPEEAKNLMLTFGNGRRPVALDLEPANGHSHSETQSEGDGHSHGEDGH